MRFLLVDDEAFARHLLIHQLGRLGFTDVTALERGADAVEILERDPSAIDIVLLDLQMPEMDGVEFVRHLARIRFQGGVILISGEDARIIETTRKLAAAHRLNVHGALHKPVTPEQLQALLGEGIRPNTKSAFTPGKSYPAARVRQAIAEGELMNFYQPKVEFATGKFVGVETLVRWKHPDDGMVFPDQFITVAEENDLIDDLTRVVLAGALRQARLWEDAGLALHVAVNVSMANLSSLDFPEYVLRAIAEAGVSKGRLVLEVTESRLMNNALAALDILTRLRLKHIGLSIDDFGTGHSSLAQLRDIPFDELKLDRGFVHGAMHDPSNRAILEANLGLARQLGMHSVAEGIEDREDWDALRGLHCDVAQGYFIARPMPGPAIADWVREWEPRRAALCPE